MNTFERCSVTSGGAPDTPGPSQASLPAGGPPVRRAVWLVLKGRGAQMRASADDLARARTTIIENAATVNAQLIGRLLGERFDPNILSSLDLPGVLELTARSDPAGCAETARRLRAEVARFLTLYDWVDDKSRLFEGLTYARAATVTRLFRLRRSLDELLTTLAGGDASGRLPVQ